jgi:predicted enzyme related to lactoylglutathione lyase
MKSKGVIHFEMPTKDKERVKKFYESAFGWKVQIMGPEFGGYVLATSADSDENGPKERGAINGGFFEWKEDNQYPSVVIDVDNIDEAMKRVEGAGGKVLQKPQEIPGIGMWAVFEDSEGNRVSMLQSPSK